MIYILLFVIVVVLVATLSQSKRQTEIIARAAHDQIHGPVDQASPADEPVLQYLRKRDTIGALREYRARTGCDLPTAQAKIAALQRMV